jgi:hypothetical protein
MLLREGLRQGRGRFKVAGQLNKSWHKMPGEKQEHYEMFMVWCGLPYEDPPKERTIREVYRRKTSATGNPSSRYFRVRDDNRWVQRATDYDAHRQAQIQEAEDEAFARVAGEIAEKEAISVERMRVEMANFVDDVGPEVRWRIREMLQDEDRELSLTSLVQVQRVVLDTVKLLDRGDADEEPQGMTDEEWEKLLGEYMPEEDD